MVRASPTVVVEVSIVVYWVSESFIAVCNTTLTAVGVLPKIVGHRTVRLFSGKPV